MKLIIEIDNIKHIVELTAEELDPILKKINKNTNSTNLSSVPSTPVENKINYDAPRPAPIGNIISQGLSDPFKGTSWGVNK